MDRTMWAPLDATTYRKGLGLNVKSKHDLWKDKGQEHLLDIRLPQFDYVRKELLPISYTLGQWLTNYLIPASHQRDDLVIPNSAAFESIATGFLMDPCDRLVRNDTDGEYYLYSRRVVIYSTESMSQKRYKVSIYYRIS